MIKSNPQNFANHARYQQILQLICAYMDDHGFKRVDIPVLLPCVVPESYLEYFETSYIGDGAHKLYLSPSPESILKRLLAEGIGNCYFLDKSYRNSEPSSSRHLGEFKMLEFYMQDTSLHGLADYVLGLLRSITIGLGIHTITYANHKVKLDNLEKITVAEAFSRYAGITSRETFDAELFLTKAAQKGYTIHKSDGSMFAYEDLWTQIYATEVEPRLGTNGALTMIYDYPTCFAPLSKPNPDGLTSARFELYIGGMELANACEELTDRDLQASRIQNEVQSRKISGKIEVNADYGFLDAISRMRPTSGIAIGVERLAVVLLGLSSIRDLQLVEF